jgi:hypothetical protein
LITSFLQFALEDLPDSLELSLEAAARQAQPLPNLLAPELSLSDLAIRHLSSIYRRNRHYPATRMVNGQLSCAAWSQLASTESFFF